MYRSIKNINKSIFLCLAAVMLTVTAVFCVSGCFFSADGEPENTMPVSELTCITPKAMSKIIALDDAKVLSCWTDYEENITYIDVVDVRKDKLIEAESFEGALELSEESFADGTFAVLDRINTLYYFIDEKLKIVDTVTVPDINGVFSHDRSSYYYLNDSILRCMNVSTGKSDRVKLEYDLRFMNISGIHPTKEWLILHPYTSDYESTAGTAVVDANTGKYEILQKVFYEPEFNSEIIYSLTFDLKSVGYNLTFRSAEKGYYSTTASELKCGSRTLDILSESPYMIGVSDNTLLCRIGAESVYADLSTCGLNGELQNSVYLPEAEIIVGGVYTDGIFKICTIIPSVIAFESVCTLQTVEKPLLIDASVAEKYFAELKGPELPEIMKKVRDRADAMEQQYNIRILLSNECEKACQNSNYVVTTTDKAGWFDERRRIEAALDGIESSLKLYPSDFFRQFKNSSGEGGIRFLLIGPVTNDAATVGFSYENRYWNNIAIDISIDTVESITCHELWHATENLICASDPGAFASEVWDPCNPEGFQYYREYNISAPDQDRWTSFSGSDEGVYFVDAYARTNEREDRARIMEFIMTSSYSDYLIKSPYINKKLKIMSDAVRKTFDTTDWKNVFWERYF